MHGKKIFAMAAALFCAGLPAIATAQSDESAGVVTTVNGDATLIRAAMTAPPVSLRMRDEIFVRDRIHTQERSLVRVLLDGKALITVRELSVLTVTEEAGRVTVDLQSGKVGVAVVKSRMRPGEVIEIRSPNATAAVRGTVFVVEVDPVKAVPAAGAPVLTTRVHLFHGALDVSARLDPGQRTVQLAEMQSVVVAGDALGAVRPISRDAVAALTADLKPAQVHTPDAPREFTGALVAREQGRAIMLASMLVPPTPGSPTQSAPRNVKGTVIGVAATLEGVSDTADSLSGTVTNLTDTTAETLERLMDTLGLGSGAEGLVGGVGGSVDELGNALRGTVGTVGNTLGNTVEGLVNGLGNVAAGGSSLGSSAGNPAGTIGIPIVNAIAPPVINAVPPIVNAVVPPVTNAVPPIVNAVISPVLNVAPPIVNPITNALGNLLGGAKK